MNLKHHGDTHLGSYYGSLNSLITMFSSMIEVFEVIVNDGTNFEQRCEANNLFELMQSFNFAFSL